MRNSGEPIGSNLHSPGRHCIVPALILILLVLGAPFLAAEGPALAPGKEVVAPTSSKGVPEKSGPASEEKGDWLGGISVPGKAIIAVVDSTADALRRVPNAVVLSADAVNELRNEIERLRKLLEKAQPPSPPSSCHIKGKVEGSLATLQVQFEFVTTTPDALVSLGCAPALASGVSLTGKDGPQVPQLLGGSSRRALTVGGSSAPARERNGDSEGFLIRLEKPDRYQLTLDLVVALSGSGSAGRPGTGTGTDGLLNRPEGLLLELPRAAWTTLELDLPSGSRDIRINGKSLSESQLKGNHLTSGALGPLDRLDLTWKSARDIVSARTPVFAAHAAVQVRLDPKEMSSETRLTLQVLSGQVNQWRLLVPLKAEISLAPEDQARVAKMESVDQKDVSLRTIRLKETSSDSLAITITTSGSAPRVGARFPIGPFTVLGAVRQTADVLIYSALRELYPAPSGDLGVVGDPATNALVPRELTPSERGNPTLAAAFRASAFLEKGTATAEAGGGNRPGKPPHRAGTHPWLELELDQVRGLVKTRVEHVLELIHANQDVDSGSAGPGKPEGDRVDNSTGQRRWRILTNIRVTPRQSAVFGAGDRLLVHMPAGCEFVEEGTNLPDKVRVSYDRVNRVVEFRFQRTSLTPPEGTGPPSPPRSPLEPFNVTVEALYPVLSDKGSEEGGGLRRLLLGLPRPQETLDEGSEIKVVVPRDAEVLLPFPGGAEVGTPGIAGGAVPVVLGLELVKHTHHELTWRSVRRSPGQVEVAWRPYRPEVRVSSAVDLALQARQGVVRQELRFQTKGSVAGEKKGPVTYILRIPSAIRDSLRVIQGGPLRPPPSRLVAPAGYFFRTLTDPGSDAAGQLTSPLVLTYSFASGRAGSREEGEAKLAPLATPLVVPILAYANVGGEEPNSLPSNAEGACLGETRVRVWGEPGELPNLVAGVASTGLGWTEQPLEEWTEGTPTPSPFVKGRLPALVLRTDRLDLPLILRRGEGKPIFMVLVDRALVQVQLESAGTQVYRVRYRLGQLNERHIDLGLPAPAATSAFKAFLDGEQVDHEILPEEDGSGISGRLVRLRLPALRSTGLPTSTGGVSQGGANILEIRYQLAPNRLGGGILWTPLTAPVLRGSPADIPTRWHVSAPSGWVLLSPEADPGVERVWGLRGWLPAPRLALNSADLERWLVGSDWSTEAESNLDQESSEQHSSETQLVWWARTGRNGPDGGNDRIESVILTHVPEQIWLLLCSLGLLLLSLCVWWFTSPRNGPALAASGQTQSRPLGFSWGWLVVAVLVLLTAASILLWPALMVQVAYGCQPGAFVLVLVASGQWLLHERRRRQIIFLSSFSRGNGHRQGNSRTHQHHQEGSQGSARLGPKPGPGEPSTVDAPNGYPGSGIGNATDRSSAHPSKSGGKLS